MEKVKGYLEGRVNDLLRKALAFDQKLFSDKEAMVTLQQKLIELKSGDPEKGFKKAKEHLKEFQTTGFYSLLLEQNMGIIYSAIKEIHSMDKALELELSIDEAYQERYDEVGKSPSELFVLDTKGDVELVENEIGSKIKQDLEGRALADEVLKTIYGTIPVKG